MMEMVGSIEGVGIGFSLPPGESTIVIIFLSEKMLQDQVMARLTAQLKLHGDLIKLRN